MNIAQTGLSINLLHSTYNRLGTMVGMAVVAYTPQLLGMD